MKKNEMVSSENLKKLMEHLRTCFPGIFSEVRYQNGKMKKGINLVLLQKLFGMEGSDEAERYEFNWIGKKAALLECSIPSHKILKPVIHESKDWDSTGNLYIEGDNLDVLKLLQKSYNNQVKMIYIDPPYNTGNDFIYRDDYSMVDEDYEKHPDVKTANEQSHIRFHSGWCSMMYPRLVLARNLMTEDGIIFISIDEYELDNLKKICNEVFGENNFITIIGLEITKTQGMKVKSAKEGSIVKNYEYVLCYAKNTTNKKIVKNILFDKNDGYDHHFSYYIEKLNGSFVVRKLVDVLKENREILEEFKKYQLVGGSGRISIGAVETAISVSGKVREYLYGTIAKNVYQEMACAVTIPPEIEQRLCIEKVVEHKGYLLTKSTGGKLRQYGSLEETLKKNDEYQSEYGRVTIRGNLWKGFYSDMMNVAKEGEVEYKNGKKPVRLIYQLAKWIGVEQDELVMDFFSGSATTAHAVMELNLHDSGNRRFIMVQLNEDLDEALKAATGENRRIVQKTIDFLDSLHKPHYLSELGKHRILKTGDKIAAAIQKEHKNKGINPDNQKPDLGFRVFRLENSNLPQESGTDNLDRPIASQALYREQQSGLDLFFAALLELGLPLTTKHVQDEIEGSIVFRTVPSTGKNVIEPVKNRQQTLFDMDVPKRILPACKENHKRLIACFDSEASERVILRIAKKQPDYFVFHESIFDSVDKSRMEEIFRENAPETILKVIG
ncbi:MAG: site-specific DNA-methyltransferase [Thermoclostridium sp.]|nr:site-specific DNA-methyltransferase [Thermoclostridium sp.]